MGMVNVPNELFGQDQACIPKWLLTVHGVIRKRDGDPLTGRLRFGQTNLTQAMFALWIQIAFHVTTSFL
jgi:hypothetical protein